MRKILFLSLCLGLIGCAAISRSVATDKKDLLKLSIGMPKEDVIRIMGTKTVELYYMANIYVGEKKRSTRNNPYRSEILRGEDKTLEVIYYVTDLKNNDHVISNDELTPLVFDNGKLIGWGWSFLQDIIHKYKLRIISGK